MGELVEFKPRVSEARKQLQAGNCAEILFFMGVRIVREPVETPQKQGRRRASKGAETPRKRPTNKAG
jgi:hypothetical protein